MDKIIITGAGVDKTKGIDFPLANQLLTEVSRFINGEGKPFEQAIRKAIPGLRFDFNRFINNEIENITKKSLEQLKDIVKLVENATKNITDDNDIHKKKGNIIIALFEKLVQIRDVSHIDDETFKLIEEAFGSDFTESDFIIDLQKMSISDTFKSILKVTLKESLRSDDNPIANAISANLLDIEQLLIQKFLGFYNQHQADVKNYIYISWCLWGFLVWKQNKVLSAYTNSNIPFYSKLPKNIGAITLNYTTFLDNMGLDKVIYFHGGLSEYVRMDTRQLLSIEDLSNIDLKKFINEEIAPNLNFNSDIVEDQMHVIPSLVPPLKLKPVLSNKYIDTWGQAIELIKEAEQIVIIGYSFNNADEHFNDIVRNNSHKQFYIIAPDILEDYFKKRIEKVFDVSLNNFTQTHIQGRTTIANKNIKLIQSVADEIDISKLCNN